MINEKGLAKKNERGRKLRKRRVNGQTLGGKAYQKRVKSKIQRKNSKKSRWALCHGGPSLKGKLERKTVDSRQGGRFI